MTGPRVPPLKHQYTYDRDMVGFCAQCMLPLANDRHYSLGAQNIAEPRKPAPILPFIPRLV